MVGTECLAWVLRWRAAVATGERYRRSVDCHGRNDRLNEMRRVITVDDFAAKPSPLTITVFGSPAQTVGALTCTLSTYGANCSVSTDSR